MGENIYIQEFMFIFLQCVHSMSLIRVDQGVSFWGRL